jgi:hypothetical protein
MELQETLCNSDHHFKMSPESIGLPTRIRPRLWKRIHFRLYPSGGVRLDRKGSDRLFQLSTDISRLYVATHWAVSHSAKPLLSERLLCVFAPGSPPLVALFLPNTHGTATVRHGMDYFSNTIPIGEAFPSCVACLFAYIMTIICSVS